MMIKLKESTVEEMSRAKNGQNAELIASVPRVSEIYM